MSAGDAVLDAKLKNPLNATTPKLKEVYSVLQHVQQRWYELFLNLGIRRHILEECLKNNPFDDCSSLKQVIVLWLQQNDPPPTWTSLVDVVENILLEGKIAVSIKKMYSCEPSTENTDDGIFANMQDDCETNTFTKLLANITEKLGPSSVPELQHFLLNLRCPNGTPLLNAESLSGHKTVDGLLMQLVDAKLCTPRDLDILIHILNGLKRHDLLPLISAYVPKITVGKPFVSSMGNCDQMFIVRVVLNEALKQIDLGIVSAIKHDLCSCFRMHQRPFLMQYIGWQNSPLILYFQVPNACMYLVEEGLQNDISHLSGNGIDYINIIINGTVLSFHVM